MEKVLLISPFYKPDYMKNGRCDFVSKSGTQWYPLHLAQAACYLDHYGFMTWIADAQAENLSEKQVFFLVEQFKPDRVIVFCGRESLIADLVWAEYFKKKGHKVALTCPFILSPKAKAIQKDTGFTFIYGELDAGALAWVKGAEGFIHEVMTEAEYAKIKGVPDKLITTCDKRVYVTPSEKYPFMDVITGRGCSYGKCSFCLFPKSYRCAYLARPLSTVMDEIAFVENDLKFRSVMIQDDTFPEERAKTFSWAKLERGLKIAWSCYARAELTLATMRLMKSAGCMNLHVGYESGSPETLKRIRKGLTIEQMAAFTRDAKKAGLSVHSDWLIGIDHTEQEIFDTIDFACKIRPHTAQFQVFIPYFSEPVKHDRERLEELMRYAYKKFYGNIKGWPAVIRQIGKPKIISRSIKSVLGIR